MAIGAGANVGCMVVMERTGRRDRLEIFFGYPVLSVLSKAATVESFVRKISASVIGSEVSDSNGGTTRTERWLVSVLNKFNTSPQSNKSIYVLYDINLAPAVGLWWH